ncbi:MAG: hypothetical protein GX442_24300 [Candidatus Riflebacteria bacterium]|nr:hypothetical protein [Candidatus Riflebacteria bacterium]
MMPRTPIVLGLLVLFAALPLTTLTAGPFDDEPLTISGGSSNDDTPATVEVSDSPFTEDELNIRGIEDINSGNAPTPIQPTPNQPGSAPAGGVTAKDVQTSVKLIEGYLQAGDLDAAVRQVKTLREQMKTATGLSQIDRWDQDVAEKQVIVQVVSRIISGMAKLESQARDPAANKAAMTATLTDLQHWITILADLDAKTYASFLKIIKARLEQIKAALQNQGGTTPVAPTPTAPKLEIPYFPQSKNALYSNRSSQNCCVAMMLATFGWKGTPDYLSEWWGTGQAQSPNGAAELFNNYASKEKMPVRAAGEAVKVADFESRLKNGEPMIVFTTSGHVLVVTGFDGKAFDVMDPGGQWDQKNPGTRDSKVSGAHLKYGRDALEAVLNRNGEVSAVTFDKAR